MFGPTTSFWPTSPFLPAWPKPSPRVPAPWLTDVWARVLSTRLQPSSHVWRSFAVSFGAACGADLRPDASNESSRRYPFTQSLGRSGSLPARHRFDQAPRRTPWRPHLPRVFFSPLLTATDSSPNRAGRGIRLSVSDLVPATRLYNASLIAPSHLVAMAGE